MVLRIQYLYKYIILLQKYVVIYIYICIALLKNNTKTNETSSPKSYEQ